MKKQFLNLGKALNKSEQKQIFGGEMLNDCKDECGAGNPCSNGQCIPFDVSYSCPGQGIQMICMPLG